MAEIQRTTYFHVELEVRVSEKPNGDPQTILQSESAAFLGKAATRDEALLKALAQMEEYLGRVGRPSGGLPGPPTAGSRAKLLRKV